jgi:hypothetical protein
MKDILMLAVSFDWGAPCPHHNQQLIACSSSLLARVSSNRLDIIWEEIT